jgi:hypothetical protein
MPEEKTNQQQKEPEQQPEERGEQQPEEQTEEQTEPVSFPWLMLCLAILFDAIGFLCSLLAGFAPFLAFLPLLSESLAGLIFGFWQTFYVPQTNPALTFIVAKIIDALSLGFLPSNIGIVVYAYIKKKSFSLSKTPLGQMAIEKLSPQAQVE